MQACSQSPRNTSHHLLLLTYPTAAPPLVADVADRSYQDVLGRKTYSNRKIGRLVAEALISSKPKERVVVTPATLDGATLTV